MPLSRPDTRANLTHLLQYQLMKDREYGRLLLMAWYDIQDEAQDVFVVQVFERFASSEGSERSTLRFPGMGNMWLPGLYHVEAFSDTAFRDSIGARDPLITKIQQQLIDQRAEIIWPLPTDPNDLLRLLQQQTL